MQDRDHHALRLVAVLAAVLSFPAPSRAEDPVAKPKRWSHADVAKAYAEYRRPPTDSVQLPRRPADPDGTDPFLLMLHKSLSRNVNDPESMQVFGSLSTRSVDPLDENDLLRRCRVAVRGRLKEMRLPFDVDPGRAVNLGSLAVFESTPPAPAGDDALLSDTAQTAASKAAGRKRLEQWKVAFRPTYHGVPLEKLSSVVILVSGDNLKIDWRNLPQLNQLPPDSELKANVSPDQALATGLDNFRRRVEERGDKALAEKLKLEPETPSLNLWFPSEGVGRLAWTFSVTARTDEDAHVGSGRYHIEACKPSEEAKPKILAHFSTPVLHSVGAHAGNRDGRSLGILSSVIGP